MCRKPSITIWPASVPVSVEFWPEASSATANSTLAAPGAQHRRQQLVRVVDVGHVEIAIAVKGGGGRYQNGRIHEKRQKQRHRRVDGGRT